MNAGYVYAPVSGSVSDSERSVLTSRLTRSSSLRIDVAAASTSSSAGRNGRFSMLRSNTMEYWLPCSLMRWEWRYEWNRRWCISSSVIMMQRIFGRDPVMISATSCSGRAFGRGRASLMLSRQRSEFSARIMRRSM